MQEQTSGRSGDSAAPDITAVIDEESAFPPIRRVSALRAFVWLRLGWSDLWVSPRISLLYGLCFAGMGFLLKIVLANAPQYLSALSCGFLLLGLCWRSVYTTSAAASRMKNPACWLACFPCAGAGAISASWPWCWQSLCWCGRALRWWCLRCSTTRACRPCRAFYRNYFQSVILSSLPCIAASVLSSPASSSRSAGSPFP